MVSEVALAPREVLDRWAHINHPTWGHLCHLLSTHYKINNPARTWCLISRCGGNACIHLGSPKHFCAPPSHGKSSSGHLNERRVFDEPWTPRLYDWKVPFNSSSPMSSSIQLAPCIPPTSSPPLPFVRCPGRSSGRNKPMRSKSRASSMRLGRRGELPRGSIETPAVRILFFLRPGPPFFWSLKAGVFGL